MKTLVESLFDRDLIKRGPFDDPEFKEWINQPDVLWYLYYYWEGGEEGTFHDFFSKEWTQYKPLVDSLLNIWNDATNKVFGRTGWSWWWINGDQYENNLELQDIFQSERDFEDCLWDVTYEIHHRSTQEEDGIWKVQFKGGFPKNSNITAFVQQLNLPMTKPGKLEGVICLTNDDTVIILGFPRGINKKILNLFDIK